MHSLMHVNFILKYLTTQNSYHCQGEFSLGGDLQYLGKIYYILCLHLNFTILLKFPSLM